eukprot:SAG31_NODE_45600_length_258_cov_0.654088_1_plen_49_part_01
MEKCTQVTWSAARTSIAWVETFAYKPNPAAETTADCELSTVPASPHRCT